MWRGLYCVPSFETLAFGRLLRTKLTRQAASAASFLPFSTASSMVPTM
jgi:hypothetical protein